MKGIQIVLFGLVLCAFFSCKNEEVTFPFKDISTESFEKFRTDRYATSELRLRHYIDSLRVAERDTTYIDLLTNKYYAARNPYLWIDRWGTDGRVDTLLHWLRNVSNTGLPESHFYLEQIRANLQRLKSLDFNSYHTVNRTLASLEYYLTKSYMRYSSGQRFGFVNPRKIFNRLEKMEPDSANSPFRTLFDIDVDKLSASFFDVAVHEIKQYQLEEFLSDVQPNSPLYNTFYQAIQVPNLTARERRLLTINMERSRWRMKVKTENKKVVVNLPSQSLIATDDQGNNLTMKICFGSLAHKTPLLASHISHLELNPYWIIPHSIVKKELLKHCGDTAYFSRRRYEILDRKTGESISPLYVDESQLLSGQYLVRQEQGEDNSLGRMIFRFPNNFSIYLHDTNNKAAFSKSLRAVSHGCVRLEKPYDLATFLLANDESEKISKIRAALDMDEEITDNPPAKTIRRCDYKQHIPVYIVYYTCYPNQSGQLEYYSDIYGYDDTIWKHLMGMKS